MAPARADHTKPWWWGLDLPGTKRHPSLSEPDLADHPEARRPGRRRAGRDRRLEVAAHRAGQALELGLGERSSLRSWPSCPVSAGSRIGSRGHWFGSDTIPDVTGVEGPRP